MTIETKDLSFSFGKTQVLDKLSLSVGAGELVAFLGPNGVGKTTLFRSLLGFLQPTAGTILVDGKDIGSYSQKELASRIAYIPQSYSPVFNHTVMDSVLMGVTNQLGPFGSPSRLHEEKAQSILEDLGIGHLSERGTMNISGGERQLMLIARALLQDAEILIMDEPTANLDYGNSWRVMERIRALSERGYAILFSTHDPNQALGFATRVVAMLDGRILSDTKPRDVSPEILSTLYSIPVSLCRECGGMVVKP